MQPDPYSPQQRQERRKAERDAKDGGDASMAIALVKVLACEVILFAALFAVAFHH